ncbi:MAG: glycoside hydrolase [Armatimonadota bacterium]
MLRRFLTLHLRLATVAVLVALSLPSLGPEPLVPNGGFERGLEGWSPLWTRDANAGRVLADRAVYRSGQASARVEHTGSRDWSFTPSVQISVKAGDIFRLSAWVKVDGSGSAALCAITFDAKNQPLDWAYGARWVYGSTDWRRLESRFAVPEGVARILPRLIGERQATVWLDDFELVREGNVMSMHSDLPSTLSIANNALKVTFSTADGSLAVLDRRLNKTWRQRATVQEVAVASAQVVGNRIRARLLHIPSGLDLTAEVQMDPKLAEFTVSLLAHGDLSAPVRYPHPFVTEPGTHLIIPMNEGISYPVDDPSIEPMRLIAYGGHGICMAFWGVTDGRTAQMGLIETPDDACISIERANGRLCVAPMWEAQKGAFGYKRVLRYVFFHRGDHVAICKRYRAYAKKTGLLKTLQQKRRENPNVDLLIGAVNVWCWDADALSIVRQMQSAGIRRILWSHAQRPEVIRAMNEMGVLTSRYDIYQDVMDPANFPKLQWIHGDWPTEAWPKDIMIGADGQWVRGWEVEGKDGAWYPCGVLCDRQAPAYARKRIFPELETHPYRCRFIDTTTASPWRECYHPDHPMTRSESRRYKMDLLKLVSQDAHLVTGSETGHDAAVPYVHYFEGMLSLGPYRVPDAGRNMPRIWDEVPQPVAKFQVGYQYRLPLWELVYHDCVVAQWYWGDYNNKLPAIWDRRDLFNILYGTPPMFMFTREMWTKNKDRFVRSYRDVCTVARAVGYAEMTNHQFLTPDRSVQKTTFSNGTSVVVNFGSSPHRLHDGTQVPPMGYRVIGARAAPK